MKTIIYINFILTIILIGVVVWLFAFQKPKETVTQLTPNATNNNIQSVDECGEICKKQIADSVANAISTISAASKETIKTVIQTPTPVKAKAQTAYIPIAGPITTTSSDWYDLSGTEFYLNFNTDYGKTAYANWDTSLKIKDGNGTVYARIYDVTNKIAVNGSEVSISNKGDLTQVVSGGLSFWAGNNLYRVQLKSLNGFEVTFGSGRIKIIY